MPATTGSLLPALGRALPRVGGAVLGLALLRADGVALFAVGVVLFVLSVLTNPARWWHYVRTGSHPERPPAAELTEPGAYKVELHSPGSRPLEVVKAIREVTGAGPSAARAQVQATPATVADGLSADSAEHVRDRLEGAGATAVVIAPTDR